MANVRTVWERTEYGEHFASVETTIHRWVAGASRIVYALVVIASLAFLALDWLFPLPLNPQLIRAIPRDAASRVVRARDGHWRIPLVARDIPPELARAVIASEDQWFAWHPGVNPVAVLRAAWTNWRSGRIVTGASTIAMQVARLIEPAPRTPWAKCHEAFRALQLQHHLSSAEVLAIYLNLSRYGGTIEGIGAASHVYFGKPPAQLSLGEVALLTALPQARGHLDPIRNSALAQAARNDVLDRLAERGAFSPQAIAGARRMPVLERSIDHAGLSDRSQPPLG